MSLKMVDDVYMYTTIFNISSEQGLDDFWSYCIFRLNLEKNEHVYDRFARLYNFLSDHKKILSADKSIYISLKESCQEYFIHVETTIQLFLSTFMHRLDLRGYSYVYDQKTLQYSINKHSTNPSRAVAITKPTVEVFGFISRDDLEEMSDCLEKMQDKNYEKAYHTLTLDEINDYRTTLSYYSSFLKLYPQLNTMSGLIAELSVILSLYTQECLTLGLEFRKLLQSFLNSISFWQETLFVRGGEELNFMDNSFKADLAQIKMTLNLYDESVEEEQACTLEDIFDF